MNWIRKQVRIYLIYRALVRAQKQWDGAQDGAEWNACRNRYARLLRLMDKATKIAP